MGGAKTEKGSDGKLEGSVSAGIRDFLPEGIEAVYKWMFMYLNNGLYFYFLLFPWFCNVGF